MGGNVEMNHAAPMMGQNHKDKEDSKVHRRHDEEIGRDQLLQMTVEERTPRRGAAVAPASLWSIEFLAGIGSAMLTLHTTRCRARFHTLPGRSQWARAPARCESS